MAMKVAEMVQYYMDQQSVDDSKPCAAIVTAVDGDNHTLHVFHNKTKPELVYNVVESQTPEAGKFTQIPA